jgi:hypothetical protein
VSAKRRYGGVGPNWNSDFFNGQPHLRDFFPLSWVSDLNGVSEELPCLRCGFWECSLENRLSRFEIPLHVRGGERQERPNTIIAMPARVFVESARQVWVKMNSEQIVHSRCVFVAAESVVVHRTAFRHSSGLTLSELSRQKVDYRAEFGRGGLRLLLWRHLAGLHSKRHLCPALSGI